MNYYRNTLNTRTHDDAIFAIDRPPKYRLEDLTKIGGQKPVAAGHP